MKLWILVLAKAMRILTYAIAIAFVLYLVVSLVEVNLFNLDSPEKISEWNYFVVMVKLAEVI